MSASQIQEFCHQIRSVCQTLSMCAARVCTVSAVGFCSKVVGAAAVGVAAGTAGGVATCKSAAGVSSSQQANRFEKDEEQQAVHQQLQTRNDDISSEVQRKRQSLRMINIFLKKIFPLLSEEVLS